MYIKKNFPIATLQFLDNFYDITSVNVDKFDCANFNMEDNTAASAVNHSSVIIDIHDTCTNVQLNDCKESQNQFDKFVSYFNIILI